MGVGDRVPKHGHALGWRDDEADFPIQVLTILPSLACWLLAQLPFDRSKEIETLSALPASSRGLEAGRLRLSGGKDRPGDPGRLGGLSDDRHFDRPARQHGPRRQAVARSCRRRALRMRVAAPGANSLRSRPSPCRLSPGERRLPAEECWRGVMPAQAAKSRPRANCRPSPIAATIAWAVMKPRPEWR